ncbi:hypothetical protein HYU12_00135 [Candidatus Woesearchaeota archaeon]|nr:hypothetical protein [Candidatus Woesearchaeota archaeon]
MAGLNAWIETQLKKGYTLREIRSFLIKKGYASSVVKQVDKFKDTNTPQKTKNYKTPAIAAIAVAVALLALWLWPALENLKLETAEDASPEDVNALCSQFNAQGYKTPCHAAVLLALYDTPGTLQSVTTGTMQIQDVKTGEMPESAMWLIDIKPQKQMLSGDGTPVKTVRIGVGLEKDEGLHRRYIT